MPRILWAGLVVFFIGAGACQKSSTDREQAKATNPNEVFLNMNPVLGKSEFSIKDKDKEYGNYLLGQLARVL